MDKLTTDNRQLITGNRRKEWNPVNVGERLIPRRDLSFVALGKEVPANPSAEECCSTCCPLFGRGGGKPTNLKIKGK
jgi:hypothetical protein